jgi:hypothetical protein
MLDNAVTLIKYALKFFILCHFFVLRRRLSISIWVSVKTSYFLIARSARSRKTTKLAACPDW